MKSCDENECKKKLGMVVISYTTTQFCLQSVHKDCSVDVYEHIYTHTHNKIGMAWFNKTEALTYH